MKKRFLSILLALCMATQFVPTAALAAQPDAVVDGAATLEVAAEPDQADETAVNAVAETGGAAAVALTLLLPDDIYADGGAATGVVTRTVGADGKIDPIVISCEGEGAFSAELAEQINKNPSISENGLHVTYSADGGTLTLSGSPTACARLDMEEILTAAMEESGAYDAELADTVARLYTVQEVAGATTLGITIERCNAGGYILVKSGATLTLDGATVDGKSIESTYPMIKVEMGGTLIIKSGTVIKNCVTSENGGAIQNSGTLTMEGGEITGCTAKINGGGVYSYGTLNMAGGSITGNKATIDGGGVCNDGTLTMTEGSVTDNNADYTAGGVANFNVFTMTGGSISNNKAVYEGGGVFNYATLKLSG